LNHHSTYANVDLLNMDASGGKKPPVHRDSIPELMVDKVPNGSALMPNFDKFDDDADIDDADMDDDFPEEARGVQSTKVNQLA